MAPRLQLGVVVEVHQLQKAEVEAAAAVLRRKDLAVVGEGERVVQHLMEVEVEEAVHLMTGVVAQVPAVVEVGHLK